MSLSTGLAFGHWHDLVNVNMNVDTGNTCMQIVGTPTQQDVGPDWTLKNDSLPLNVATNYLVLATCPGGCSTDIGNCSATIDSNGNLIIVMQNVYPTYANKFDFDVYNCGTVPMAATNVTFLPVNNTAGSVTIAGKAYLQLDLNGDGKNDTEIVWGNALTPICPGDIPTDFSFYIHFLEPIPQHVTLVLEIHLNYENCEPNGVVPTPD